jgi:hypothetical protein
MAEAMPLRGDSMPLVLQTQRGFSDFGKTRCFVRARLQPCRESFKHNRALAPEVTEFSPQPAMTLGPLHAEDHL